MITVEKIPFEKVPQLSDRDVAYVANDEKLRPFFKYPVTLEAFRKYFYGNYGPSAQSLYRSSLLYL